MRIKITFPDGTDQVAAFTGESKASDIAALIQQKIGHSSFFMTLMPQRRIREEELSQMLSQLNISGSAAIRVYDIEAGKQRAEQYEKEKAEKAAAATRSWPRATTRLVGASCGCRPVSGSMATAGSALGSADRTTSP